MKKIKIILFLICITCVGVAYWGGSVNFPNTSSDPIIAEVRLKNNCSVPDSSFVVQDTKTRRTARFSGGGVARLESKTNHNLVLQLSGHFDAVEFNGTPQRAKAQMVLTAACDSSEKAAETLRSLRKALGDN
jgi:hypothetical protein